MSELLIYASNHENTFYQNISNGASEEAGVVCNHYKNALKELRDTVLFSKEFKYIENSIKCLKEVFTETCEEDWDGEGARAVDYSTFEKASEFIHFLPDTLPEPEISADPDGEISIDWYGRGNNVFSISINKSGKLSYAALYGRKSFHGVEYFNCEIPNKLLIDIKNVIGL